MCKGVVAAQSSEIGFMKSFLKAHGYSEEPALCADEPAAPAALAAPLRAATAMPSALLVAGVFVLGVLARPAFAKIYGKRDAVATEMS